jgi:peptidoglycan hydrolase-like protein with peptidoglycan-binding domain
VILPVRRRRAALIGAGSALLVVVAGLSASRFVKSPQQVAAEAAPAGRTQLTAPIERRVLADTVVVRGLVSAAVTVDVTPTVREGGRAVVTGVRVRQGDQVGAGAVIVEVAGRPLFVLPGTVPAYRDMRPGGEGHDVGELQAALRGLGYAVSDRSGFFGAETKRAVDRFYTDRGFAPPTAGPDDADRLDAARQRVRTAQRAVDAAEEALAAARAQSPDQVKDAERTVRYAREDLAAARLAQAEVAARTGPMVPLAEVVFLPNLPARVEKLTATVAAEAKPPLVTLSSGGLSIRAKVGPAQRALLKPGLPVTVISEVIGANVSGVIEGIGEAEQDANGVRAHTVHVKPNQPLDAAWLGQDVRVTVEAARTDGEVLVVPLAAVHLAADGGSFVVKVSQNGREERVTVTAGMSGDGYVAIQPSGAALEPGDRVVIGR